MIEVIYLEKTLLLFSSKIPCTVHENTTPRLLLSIRVYQPSTSQ